IVGGGPAGLLCAIMLARLGWKNIKVLERCSEPPPPLSASWGNPDRSYNLGIGSRGQCALKRLGAWDEVEACTAPVVGRKDWRPDGTVSERVFPPSRRPATKVLQRDRLSSCLFQHVRTRYADRVEVLFEAECETVLAWPGEGSSTGEGGSIGRLAVRLGGPKSGELVELATDFIVGADGVKSAVRDAMEADSSGMRAASGRALRVARYKDSNVRVYRTVLLRLPGGGKWRGQYLSPVSVRQ
ncbi:unnamed protein product, partial [Phaeothamnion confervicola]